MSPIDWAMTPLKKYADFSGRAPRPEYWWFTLAYMVVFYIAMIIESLVGLDGMVGPYGLLTALVGLALLVPSIAVGARRLHDGDRSGWWLLIALVPILGAFILLYFLVTAGTDGPNRFGEKPAS